MSFKKEHLWTPEREDILKSKEYEEYKEQVLLTVREDILNNSDESCGDYKKVIENLIEAVSGGVLEAKFLRPKYDLFFWYLYIYLKNPYPDFVTEEEKDLWEYCNPDNPDESTAYSILQGNVTSPELTEKLLHDEKIRSDVRDIVTTFGEKFKLDNKALWLYPKLKKSLYQGSRCSLFKPKPCFKLNIIESIEPLVFETASYIIINLDIDRITASNLEVLLYRVKEDNIGIISSEKYEDILLIGTEEELKSAENLLKIKNVVLDKISFKEKLVTEALSDEIDFLKALEGDYRENFDESFYKTNGLYKSDIENADNFYRRFRYLKGMTPLSLSALQKIQIEVEENNKVDIVEKAYINERPFNIEEQLPLIYNIEDFNAEEILGVLIPYDCEYYDLYILTNTFCYGFDFCYEMDSRLKAQYFALESFIELANLETHPSNEAEEYKCLIGIDDYDWKRPYKYIYLALKTNTFTDNNTVFTEITPDNNLQQDIYNLMKDKESSTEDLIKNLINYGKEKMMTPAMLQFINVCDGYIGYQFDNEITPLSENDKIKMQYLVDNNLCGDGVKKVFNSI